jgi:hypothetical protein
MVETYGLDECVDAGQLLRVYLAEMRGCDLLDKRTLDAALETVTFSSVTDPKDTYDRVISDKNSLGARRSLALTVAGLKQQLRGKSIFHSWTDTSNMLTDPLTKPMDAMRLDEMLERGTWSVTHNQDFIRTKVRSRASRDVAVAFRELLSGLPALEEEITVLDEWGKVSGWSQRGSRTGQVARDTEPFRSPEPRYSSAAHPWCATFGQFRFDDDSVVWQRLDSASPTWT